MAITKSPSQSSPLEDSVQFLKSIGPVRAKLLEAELGIKTIRDFLFHFPYRHIDRSTTIRVRDLFRWNYPEPKSVTIVGAVEDFYYTSTKNPKARAVPFTLVLADETGKFAFTFWRPQKFIEEYWMKRFTRGESIALSATFEKRNAQLKYTNVEYDKLTEDGMQFHTGGIVPLYSSTQQLQEKGLWSSTFRVLMHATLPRVINFIEEIFPKEILQRNNLFSLRDAIQEYHFPTSLANVQKARKRLAFEELFFFQLLLAYRRKDIVVNANGISFHVTKGGLPRKLLEVLPFQLTTSQENVLKEIVNDMRANKPMNRLLQGDVGSGKTIVALLAVLIAVENGYQCALMSPTEILAEQHFRTLKHFLEPLNIKVELLVGKQKVKLRREILSNIQNGIANIVVGTHALIQDKVEFQKLGFIVIDEQHRFGVMQRTALREKANGSAEPDVLVMTATPIPRTLSMTLYGDMDVSTITELPKNRKAIITKLVPRGKSSELKEFLLKQIEQGRQIYIVYPLIEESEKLDLKAALDGFEKLRTQTFPQLKERIGLVHGKLSSVEKDDVMKNFISHELDILVSTTVIEVGIDVPNASVMVVVNAERFGLSQLHQLRGRVGRGSEQSYCFLQSNEENNQRLAVLVQTTDGFEIAEQDLKQRGPGDYFGTRQSGIPEFKHVNFWEDKEIFSSARNEAFKLVESDSHLRLPQHSKIKSEFERKYFDALKILL
ncbi:MAG: ATP-dependent DNA helicase RecG [Ignavibacteriales bacterium]|nr:ATP-dependent DNA helicase RecG [Ignavibacteriales bacterium]